MCRAWLKRMSNPATVASAYRRRVIATLMFVQVMAGLGHGVTFSMGSLLISELLGSAWGGTALALTMGGAALWAVPLGHVVAARGRRASLTVGLSLGILGAISALTGAQLGFAPLVLLGFLLLGGEVATNYQARFAAVDVAVGKHRGRDLSLVMWATTVGAVVGPQLIGLTEGIGAHFGLVQFAGAYLLCITVQFLGILLLQFGLRPELRPSDKPQREKIRVRSNPEAVFAMVTVAASHFAMIGIMSMTAVHLHHHGAGLGWIGIVISGHVGAMYALAPIFGILSDRAGASRAIAFGVLLNVTAAAVVVIFAQSQVGVLIGLILLGFGWSATLVGGSALLVRVTKPAERAAYQGRNDLIMNVCGASGGILAGPIVAAFGLPILAGAMGVLVLALAIAGPVWVRSQLQSRP